MPGVGTSMGSEAPHCAVSSLGCSSEPSGDWRLRGRFSPCFDGLWSRRVAFSFDEKSGLASPGEKAICSLAPLAPLGITFVDTLTAAPQKGMRFAPSLLQPWEPRAAKNPLHLSLDIAAT